MRVLMLGWEFPPHLSGGLGTACYGLCRGLAASNVQVAFVMPRATGDEEARGVEIVGCNRVPVRAANGAAATPHAATATAVADRGAPATATSAAALESMLELLAIDSPLRAYATAASYAEQVAGQPGLAPEALAIVGALRKALAHGSTAAIADLLAAAAPADGSRFLAFSGGYGPDLMDEVARYALVVASLARTRAFDIVHAHDWLTVPAGIAAARLSGKPLVLHVHASEYDRSGENVNTQVRDIEQLGLEAADRVICVSHFTRKIVARRYRVDPRKLRVVHNAVLQSEQARQWRAPKTIDDPIVLFLGRVTFQKGPDYFLEAAARVVRAMPRVKFVMSGSGDMLPTMVERAARMGLARNVHFTGFLRGRDVERMYAMASIYVMPSVSEPFGISPLEALALDVPVIVSRQSGVSEILTSALKVDFWNVNEIADKILAVLRHQALARQLREDGRQEVRGLRWEQQGRLVKAVYEELTH
jgi:glycosyltransferase involved in cell wall biosynthesis